MSNGPILHESLPYPSAFISQVKTQSGKGLTVSQATQLTNEATVIKTRLGC